jgi:hypothetical protein
MGQAPFSALLLAQSAGDLLLSELDGDASPYRKIFCLLVYPQVKKELHVQTSRIALTVTGVFWVLLIAASITATGVEILNRETNPKVLIRRKTQALRKSLNRPDLRSVYEPATELSNLTTLMRGLVRPLKLFFRSPIVFLLSLYMSFIYGLL